MYVRTLRERERTHYIERETHIHTLKFCSLLVKCSSFFGTHSLRPPGNTREASAFMSCAHERSGWKRTQDSGLRAADEGASVELGHRDSYEASKVTTAVAECNATTTKGREPSQPPEQIQQYSNL